MKNKIIYIVSILLLSFAIGCKAKISIDKRPSIAFPITNNVTHETNDWIIVDQGYEVHYSKWGFNTEIQSMSAELTSNKTIRFQIGGYHSNMITNNIHLKLDDFIKIMGFLRETTNNIQFVEKSLQ